MKFLITTEQLKQFNVEIVRNDINELVIRFFTLSNQYIASYPAFNINKPFNLNAFDVYTPIDELSIWLIKKNLQSFKMSV
jgi:hypothetical protein